jgi:hypothetical protein
MQSPLTSANNNKLEFKVSVYLKSLLPLQAYVSHKVAVLEAKKPYFETRAHLAEKEMH